ncbi:MAG: aldose epimerase [Leptolyngbyaceae cyanobacterium RM2_2_4]|nr:aldose epimerase [Leptolyngbyaceae cyanobacterium SM1_4_3]NJO50043.1 aldose epimerase [Leptolyngbyaceae cyanobacterium RM2_2_4]
MFAIDLEQKQYKIYILSDQTAQSRLEVVPERGGIITSWQVRGREMLYLDTERFANPELTVRGGIPILFPICGNLPDNTYTYQGQSYTLKQHGFARDLPWDVTDRVTQNMVSITLVLNSNDQTRAVYPFDFQLIFTYRLQGNSLEIHQRYVNHSAEAMPFSTGLHPYFQVSNKTQLQFEIPSSQFQNQRDKSVQSFSGQFDFELDEIDASFRDLSSQSAAVTDLEQQTRLKLDYEPHYSMLVFWTVKGKDFYCLEPWSAPRNALNTGDRLIHLASGETLETFVQLTVER